MAAFINDLEGNFIFKSIWIRSQLDSYGSIIFMNLFIFIILSFIMHAFNLQNISLLSVYRIIRLLTTYISILFDFSKCILVTSISFRDLYSKISSAFFTISGSISNSFSKFSCLSFETLFPAFCEFSNFNFSISVLESLMLFSEFEDNNYFKIYLFSLEMVSLLLIINFRDL